MPATSGLRKTSKLMCLCCPAAFESGNCFFSLICLPFLQPYVGSQLSLPAFPLLYLVLLGTGLQPNLCKQLVCLIMESEQQLRFLTQWAKQTVFWVHPSCSYKYIHTFIGTFSSVVYLGLCVLIKSRWLFWASRIERSLLRGETATVPWCFKVYKVSISLSVARYAEHWEKTKRYSPDVSQK